MIDPCDLAGHRLDGVTGSWLHHPDGSASLLHVWLHFDGVGPVRLHTLSHAVDLTLDPPPDSYSMDEFGYVVVEPAPPDFVASRFVGERVGHVELVGEPAIGAVVGFILHWPTGSLRVRNLGDELVFDAEPGRITPTS